MGDEAGKIGWDGMNGEALQGGLKNKDFILQAVGSEDESN